MINPRPKLLNSKLFLCALTILVALVGYAILRERKNQREISRNLDSLKQEIAVRQNKNLELTALIKYLRSDDFIEREAREKLNMQKAGEHVVIVPPAKETGVVMGTTQITKANWQLWLEYFFGQSLN